MARNNRVRKNFEFGYGWQEKVNIFLAGAGLVLSKCKNSSPKCTKMIPRRGKKNIILIHRRGTPGKAKSGFQTRLILTRPRPVPPYPAKGCLGEKMPGLSSHVSTNLIFKYSKVKIQVAPLLRIATTPIQVTHSQPI